VAHCKLIPNCLLPIVCQAEPACLRLFLTALQLPATWNKGALVCSILKLGEGHLINNHPEHI
jgi:hypothetical protein